MPESKEGSCPPSSFFPLEGGVGKGRGSAGGCSCSPPGRGPAACLHEAAAAAGALSLASLRVGARWARGGPVGCRIPAPSPRSAPGLGWPHLVKPLLLCVTWASRPRATSDEVVPDLEPEPLPGCCSTFKPDPEPSHVSPSPLPPPRSPPSPAWTPASHAHLPQRTLLLDPKPARGSRLPLPTATRLWPRVTLPTHCPWNGPPQSLRLLILLPLT